MKRPEVLKKGDSVALVNPAGMLPDRFLKQLEYIKIYLAEMGFSVLDYVIYKNWQQPKLRADYLNQAFGDKKVKAIFPICGGKLIYEILEFLDYQVIGTNPKIICCSSELSALNTVISECTNVVTFNGPHLNFINPRASKRENLFTVKSFWNMLMWSKEGVTGLKGHEKYNYFRVDTETESNIIIRNVYFDNTRIKNTKWRDNFYLKLSDKEEISGQTLVISLESLVYLLKNNYTINLSDKILIIDTLEMGLSKIFSLFSELLFLSNINESSAIVFSSLSERTDKKQKELLELQDKEKVKNFLQKISKLFKDIKPIYFGFPLGHCAYKLTIPVGIQATIKTLTGETILHKKPFKK